MSDDKNAKKEPTEETVYALPDNIRKAIIDFLLEFPMRRVEVGVNALRSLEPLK